MAEEIQLFDWEITAGDLERRNFTFQDEDGEDVDISGRTYVAQVRTARGQPASTDPAAEIGAALAGSVLQLTLTAEQTRDLADNGRRYYWDCEEYDELGNGPVTVIQGYVLCSQDVTRS